DRGRANEARGWAGWACARKTAQLPGRHRSRRPDHRQPAHHALLRAIGGSSDRPSPSDVPPCITWSIGSARPLHPIGRPRGVSIARPLHRVEPSPDPEGAGARAPQALSPAPPGPLPRPAGLLRRALPSPLRTATLVRDHLGPSPPRPPAATDDQAWLLLGRREVDSHPPRPRSSTRAALVRPVDRLSRDAPPRPRRPAGATTGPHAGLPPGRETLPLPGGGPPVGTREPRLASVVGFKGGRWAGESEHLKRPAPDVPRRDGGQTRARSRCPRSAHPRATASPSPPPCVPVRIVSAARKAARSPAASRRRARAAPR